MFKELIDLYMDAIEEAYFMWLSNYCCSREEKKAREEEDKEKIKEFINIWNNSDWMGLVNLLFPIIPAILCFSVHELSHGLMALALGDDTARSEGRISLNPLRHIDPVGFLMLVVVMRKVKKSTGKTAYTLF